MRTHVDLFSGIGGFALAARANGVQTLSFCEIDDKCRAFLSRAWPGVDIHDDVRTFDGLQYRGATWLLTAGVPCQPASRAGKQRGSADDRWLWPQAIRVLSAVRPTWALFENPPGIGDVGLAGILADVEGEGYETRVFGIPACAVGAPHRRERYWLVAHARQQHGGGGPAEQHTGRDLPEERHEAPSYAERTSLLADTGRLGSGQDEPERGSDGRTPDRWDHAGLGDTERTDGDWQRRQERRTAWALRGDDRSMPWRNAVWVPCSDDKFRRAPDESVDVAHGLHRSLLGALGNSIVPQVAERIIAAMIAAEEDERA